MDFFLAAGGAYMLYMITANRHKRRVQAPNPHAPLRMGDTTATDLAVRKTYNPLVKGVRHDVRFSKEYLEDYEQRLRNRVRNREHPKFDHKISKRAARHPTQTAQFLDDPVVTVMHQEFTQHRVGSLVRSKGVSAKYANVKV
ncbi:hypothetical protein QOT17_017103 [Balamuthia mandrillaris]